MFRPLAYSSRRAFTMAEMLVAVGVSGVALIGGLALLKVAGSFWQQSGSSRSAADFGLPADSSPVMSLPSPLSMAQARVLHRRLLPLFRDAKMVGLVPFPLNTTPQNLMVALNADLSAPSDNGLPTHLTQLAWTTGNPSAFRSALEALLNPEVPNIFDSSGQGFTIFLFSASSPHGRAILTYRRRPSLNNQDALHSVYAFSSSGDILGGYQFWTRSTLYPSASASLASLPSGGFWITASVPLPLRSPSHEMLMTFSAPSLR
jgi:hypothetical protein